MSRESIASAVWPESAKSIACDECGREGVIAALSLAAVERHPASVTYLCADCYVSFCWSGVVVGVESLCRGGKILVTDDPLLAYVIQNLPDSIGFRGE